MRESGLPEGDAQSEPEGNGEQGLPEYHPHRGNTLDELLGIDMALTHGQGARQHHDVPRQCGSAAAGDPFAENQCHAAESQGQAPDLEGPQTLPDQEVSEHGGENGIGGAEQTSNLVPWTPEASPADERDSEGTDKAPPLPRRPQPAEHSDVSAPCFDLRQVQ